MENFDKNYDSALVNYRPAFVYKKKDDFSIIFYFRTSADQPLKRFRKTFNLNRIPDIEARKKAAEIMAKTVTESLKNGWNPITNQFPNAKTTKAPELIKLPVALHRANQSILIKTGGKARTVSSYNSHLKHFLLYLKKTNKHDILPGEFTRMDANEYQDSLIRENYAAKTVNTKMDYVSGIFAWMETAGIIEYNPFKKISHLKENESGAHQLFTTSEILKIKSKLLKDCPQLWQFVLFIYYCYMRPASIVAIKRKDIDLDSGLLTIQPGNHKNGKRAIKQILPQHEAYLAPFLDGIKPDHFIFSNGKFLTPGPKINYPTRAAERWAEIVKNELGIKKNMYGLKHTGAAAFLAMNPGQENLKWLQMQMSHSDLQTTSIYTNKLKVVKLDQSAKIPGI